MQTLPFQKGSKAVENKAAEILKDSGAGEYLNRLFQRYSFAAAFRIPSAEFLKIGNYTRFRDVPAYAMEWLANLFIGKAQPALSGFMQKLCELVNNHKSLSSGFDIEPFTRDLDRLRSEYHLSAPPPHTPEATAPRGDFEYEIAGSVTGHDMAYNGTINLKDSQGTPMEVVRPSEVFEPLLGYRKKPTDPVDFNTRAVRILMHFLPVNKDRKLAIISGSKPVIPRATFPSKFVCLVQTTQCWVAATATFKGIEEGPGVEEVKLCELIVFLRTTMMPKSLNVSLQSRSAKIILFAMTRTSSNAVGQSKV